VFAYRTGSVATLSGVKITATGAGGHGVITSGGGTMRVSHLMVSTSGASSAAVATDRGGGTIMVNGGTFRTSGFKSPGIYSTGKITVTGATMTATGAEAAVVEGANSITVTRSTLSAARKGAHGVMLYNSMSGDASAGLGTYRMLGGSLTVAAGPAFYVTNTRAVITLTSGARVHAASGVLLRADNAGTGSGNTGAGTAALRLGGEWLTGNLVTGGTGSIAATLVNHTTLTGTIDTAALTLDKTSTWRVTGHSTLTTLAGAQISGTKITNIVGNGHMVTYRSSLAANAKLHGKTYTLSGGGELRPA
jgi:hypothetical protein